MNIDDLDIEGGSPHFLYSETIVFEDFIISLSEHDPDSIWFKKEDGEGMHIKKKLLRDYLDKFFQENM